MCQYTVQIVYQGKKYQTNVIADRNTTEEEIHRIATEQVIKALVS